MAFKDRLKQARIAKGITQEQLGQEIGVAKSTITGYEKGNSEPDMAKMEKIMLFLGVDANYLLQDEMHQSHKDILHPSETDHIKKYRTLDGHGKEVVDSVLNIEYQRMTSTPKPAEAESNVIRLDFSEQPCSAGRGTYLGPDAFSEIRVEENALTRKASFAVPVSGDSMEPTYSDGDVLLIDRNTEVSPGEIGLFILDGEGYVKKLGKKELLSLNPAYPPIPLEDSIRCCGKVIGLLQKDWMK